MGKRTKGFAFIELVVIAIIAIPAAILFSGLAHAGEADTLEPADSISGVLDWEQFSPYIQEFNLNDEELYIQYFPNDQAEEFLRENIPHFSCPDKELEKTYYFRWWTFRKHIKETPAGFVITEFLPAVPWAGKHNTISCPAGHHFYEGRWLHDQTYLEDYARFWFRGGGSPRLYSFWAANSILEFAYVHQNKDLVIDLLPDFVHNYEQWEESNLSDDGLFWQIDDRDGMEASVGGSGRRATINSYMFGDSKAIAEIADMAGDNETKNEYTAKADGLRSLVLSRLWDDEDEFFKTLPRDSDTLVDVRELHGYTPWYFSIPEDRHSVAWKFLLTSDGFKAPYGPTTAEKDHPGFNVVYEGHECQWNGPSWPMATSITLKAMANLLRNHDQSVISKHDFINLLNTYSNSHRRINKRGEEVFWIDENLNPFTGDWISRTMLLARGEEPRERGKDYNHSAFCDFVISDLVGIQPSMENSVTIDPLIPEGYWEWFCLDNVKYHGRILTVVWDRDGSKYQRGKGFSVFVDGELKHNSTVPEKVEIEL